MNIQGLLKRIWQNKYGIPSFIKWFMIYTIKGDHRFGEEMWFMDQTLKKRPKGWYQSTLPYEVSSSLERIRTRFGVTGKEIKVLEIGPGPASSLTEGYLSGRFNLVAVDLLANDYKKYFDGQAILLEDYGENIDQHYPPETFHMSHASNALDHTKNPIKCFGNMVNLVKRGGIIIVSGNVREGSRVGWFGLHKWDMFIEDRRLMCESQDGVCTDLTEPYSLDYVNSRIKEWSKQGIVRKWFFITYMRVR